MCRKILDFFFVFLLYEGALRKWIFRDLDFEIQAFRDVLPCIALIAFNLEGRRLKNAPIVNPAIKFFLIAYVLICVLTFQSLIYQPFVYFVGLRTHLAYIPLIFLIPYYLNDWESARRRVLWLLLICVPIFLLASFQSTQPATSVWNQYSRGEGIATFSFGQGKVPLIRATGTFSYITSLELLSTFIASLSVYCALIAKSSRGVAAMVGMAVVSVAAELASGSRGGVVILAVQSTLLIGFGFMVSAVQINKTVVIAAAAAISSAVALSLFAVQIDAFQARTAGIGYEEPVARIYLALLEWVSVAFDWPIGAGTGAGHQAFWQAFGQDLTFATDYWEAELSRLAFEIGLLGILIYFGLKISLCFQIVSGLRYDEFPASKLLRIFCALTCVAVIFAGSVYIPIGNVLFWVSAGAGIWAENLSRRLLQIRVAARMQARPAFSAQSG